MQQKTIGKWAYHDYNATRSRLNSQQAMVIRAHSKVNSFEPPVSVYYGVIAYLVVAVLIGLYGYGQMLGGK